VQQSVRDVAGHAGKRRASAGKRRASAGKRRTSAAHMAGIAMNVWFAHI
jgi:hypothetical protein